jgi:hypothetical protein
VGQIAKTHLVETVTKPVSDANDVGSLQEQFLTDFEAALREQPDLDAEALEFLLGHFRQTVAEVPLESKLEAPDLSAWASALNAMVENGLIDEAERNDLAWQFEQAVKPYQDAEVQTALEFARRIEEHGEEAALAWLQEQRESQSQQVQTATEQSTTRPLALSQSITKSRSRRLRGPPA